MNDTNSAYNVTADELRQFIERYEQLEAEKKDVAATQKEVMAEAKGRGYDTKVMKKLVALRKRSSDSIAEEEAVEDAPAMFRKRGSAEVLLATKILFLFSRDPMCWEL